MSFDTHVFFRAKCDYPGCNKRFESTYDWFFDQADATDEVCDAWDWICLSTARGDPRYFCPDHVHFEDGPIYFNADNPEYQPSEESLRAFYADVDTLQPLPRPECEKTILAILEHHEKKAGRK